MNVLHRRSPPRRTPALAVVAPGIAEALFATAIGLFAAIPAVLAYNKLQAEVAQARSRGWKASRTSSPPSCRGRSTSASRSPTRPEGGTGMAMRCRSGAGGGRRRRRAPARRRHQRDQHDAVHRRHAGAADHLHGGGAADDGRRAARPAADQGGAAQRRHEAGHPVDHGRPARSSSARTKLTDEDDRAASSPTMAKAGLRRAHLRARRQAGRLRPRRPGDGDRHRRRASRRSRSSPSPTSAEPAGCGQSWR